MRRLAFALVLALFLQPGRSWADDFPKPDDAGTVEVSLQTTNETLIVFLSGDGGWWGDIDAQVARDLAQHVAVREVTGARPAPPHT